MSPEHFAFVGAVRNPLLARVCWVCARRDLTWLRGYPTPTGRDCFVGGALCLEDVFVGQCGHAFPDVPGSGKPYSHAGGRRERGLNFNGVHRVREW